MTCSIEGCKNYYYKFCGKSFFRFPLNVSLRDTWVRAMGRAGYVPKKKEVICEDHFLPSRIVQCGQHKRLMNNTIPSINMDGSSSLSAVQASMSSSAPQLFPQECHQHMLQRIKQIAPDFIYKTIRILPTDIPTIHDRHESIRNLEKVQNHHTADEAKIIEEPRSLKPTTLNSLSLDFCMPPTNNYSESNSSASPCFDESMKRKGNSFQEMQHKLESNGCTLLMKASHNQIDVKQKSVHNKVRLVVCCQYCDERFPNENFLSKHQLNHLTVSDRRIFDKKYLEKSVRRGRLIPVDDKKCIRCLNCWKLFEDNRKILEHWSNADCEFFCQICGIEFARNPKQLREHVPEVHGITYKSSRRQMANIPDVHIINKPMLVDVKPILPIQMPKLQPQPQMKSMPGSPPSKKSKLNSAGRVTCNLCTCTFPNYQSKNSHMRAHKGMTSQIISNLQTMDDGPPFLTAIKEEKDADDDENDDIEMPEIQMGTSTDDPEIKQEQVDNEMLAFGSQRLLVAAQQQERSTSVNANLQESEIKQEQVDNEPLSIESQRLLFVVQQQDIPSVSASAQEKISQKIKISQVSPVVVKSAAAPAKKQPSTTNATKPVPVRNVEDNMQYDKMYNCHPCGKKFSSKTDLFQHKRICQSNNKFGCRFCLRAFVTSADLQMHIMLMHKGS